MADLIPQPHGGALRPRDGGYRPSIEHGSKGPAAGRQSVRAMRKEGTRLLADGTPYAAERLLQAIRNEDDRVAIVAASQVLEHVRKVAEAGDDDEVQGTLREDELTPDELAHLIECADHVERYIALSEQRWADRQAAATDTAT